MGNGDGAREECDEDTGTAEAMGGDKADETCPEEVRVRRGKASGDICWGGGAGGSMILAMEGDSLALNLQGETLCGGGL